MGITAKPSLVSATIFAADTIRNGRPVAAVQVKKSNKRNLWVAFIKFTTVITHNSPV